MNFTVQNLTPIFNISRLWAAIVSKGATYLQSNTHSGSNDNRLRLYDLSKFGTFSSPLLPEKLGLQCAPAKRSGKIFKLSITQSRIVRFCWKFADWCIIGFVITTFKKIIKKHKNRKKTSQTFFKKLLNVE